MTKDELYLEYVKAREYTWYVYDKLMPLDKDELYKHPTYLEAVEKEKAAFAAYLTE